MLRALVVSVVAIAASPCRPAEPESSGPAGTESPGTAAPGPAAPARDDDAAPSPASFEGRTIAATMSHFGAEWLTRPEREQEEDPATLHRELALQPGQVACDLGAGNGYHSLRMAAAVGPRGRVVASDLQPEMLALLRERVAAAGVTNIEPVLATQQDPGLPRGGCDVILVVDVYHELAQPEAVLAALREALAPRGRLVLVEFRGEDDGVPIKPEHKMTKAQIRRELEPRGFVLVREFDGLPWQHVMMFGRAAKRPSPG